MNHPLASILGQMHQQEENKVHPLSREAQIANLQAAYKHYHTHKRFTPGMICREHKGLAFFTDGPILFYIRALNMNDEQDAARVLDWITHHHGNKIDCMLMRVVDNGAVTFFLGDSDILEPMED